MRSKRYEVEVAQQIHDAGEQFRIGQVAAIAAPKVTVITSGGASMLLPRLATWTPVVGDVVLIATTPAGWVVLGKIA